MKLQDGHYRLKLLFQNKVVTVPNNCCAAQQCLTEIRKEFKGMKNFILRLSSVVVMLKWSHGMYCIVVKTCFTFLNMDFISHARQIVVPFWLGGKYKKTSLNNQPCSFLLLIDWLMEILLTFRQEPVVFILDVKSMFYQVKVVCLRNGKLSAWKLKCY